MSQYKVQLQCIKTPIKISSLHYSYLYCCYFRVPHLFFNLTLLQRRASTAWEPSQPYIYSFPLVTCSVCPSFPPTLYSLSFINSGFTLLKCLCQCFVASVLLNVEWESYKFQCFNTLQLQAAHEPVLMFTAVGLTSSRILNLPLATLCCAILFKCLSAVRSCLNCQ
jgi:hypothetical protein